MSPFARTDTKYPARSSVSSDPVPEGTTQSAESHTQSSSASPRDEGDSDGRGRVPQNTHPLAGAPWPREFKPPRPLSSKKNLWRSGDPIIFGSGTVTSWPRRDFSTSSATDMGPGQQQQQQQYSATPPGVPAVQRSIDVENKAAASAKVGGPHHGARKPKQDDAILRIRGISKDAEDHLSRLQAELQKLGLEKKKRPVRELRQALDVVLDIAERGQMLFKAAARTSEVLTRSLGRQIAEDIENAPELTSTPLWSDPKVMEDEELSPVATAEAVSDGEALSDAGPPAPAVTAEVVSDAAAAALEDEEALSGPPPAATASGDEEAAAEADAEVDELPYTPLTTYTIPEEVFESRLALADDDPGKFWNHSFYTNSEGKGVELHYCKTIEDSERVLQEFMHERVVGFDMEWIFPQRSRTSIRYAAPCSGVSADRLTAPRQNVAFVQVASESTVALIHIAQMGLDDYGRPLDPGAADDAATLVPPTLRELIESDQILKIGVNAIGDHRRLRDFINVRPRGVFELSDLHNLVSSAENNVARIPRRLVSLARQTLEYLGLPLDKGPVRISDWTKPLDLEQITCRPPPPVGSVGAYCSRCCLGCLCGPADL